MNERKEKEAFSPFRVASRKVETNGEKIAGWKIDDSSGEKFVKVWNFALVALFIHWKLLRVWIKVGFDSALAGVFI